MPQGKKGQAPQAYPQLVCGVQVEGAVYGGVHDGVCVWFFGVWPRAVWPCVRTGKRRGGPWRAPLFCGVQAAVSYSPTPWRVQYHRRWQS